LADSGSASSMLAISNRASPPGASWRRPIPRARSCAPEGLKSEIGTRKSEGQGIPVVLDYRERLVEMVQEPLPFGIALRAAEALGVRLERIPFHQQEIFAGRLDARAHFDAEEPGRCLDKRPRFA